MADFTIEIDEESYFKFRQSLKQYGNKAIGAIEKGIARTALFMETIAKQRLKGEFGSKKHWITGRLASSVHAEMKRLNTFKAIKDSKPSDGNLNQQLGELDAAIGTNVEYANKIEFEYDSYMIYAKIQGEPVLAKNITDELNKIK